MMGVPWLQVSLEGVTQEEKFFEEPAKVAAFYY